MNDPLIVLGGLLALYDRDERREAVLEGYRREVAGTVVRHVALAGRRGFILHSRLDGADVEFAVREQIATFAGLGQSFEWKVYDYDTPPDLGVRLEAQGLNPDDAETIMVLDLDRAPEALMRPVSHGVLEEADPERMGEVVAIQERVWGGDRAWLGQRLAEEKCRTPDRLRVYLARDGDVTASAAWIRFPPGSAFASLWGGATLPSHRGRGLYSALVAARAQEARRRGVRYLTVDAGAMSRPIVERLGFERLAEARGYVWHAPGLPG